MLKSISSELLNKKASNPNSVSKYEIVGGSFESVYSEIFLRSPTSSRSSEPVICLMQRYTVALVLETVVFVPSSVSVLMV